MSRNLVIRATLYRQDGKAPLWHLPRNPEMAWADGLPGGKKVRSSWTVIQHAGQPRSFMYCSSRSEIRREAVIAHAAPYKYPGEKGDGSQ